MPTSNRQTMRHRKWYRRHNFCVHVFKGPRADANASMAAVEVGGVRPRNIDVQDIGPSNNGVWPTLGDAVKLSADLYDSAGPRVVIVRVRLRGTRRGTTAKPRSPRGQLVRVVAVKPGHNKENDDEPVTRTESVIIARLSGPNAPTIPPMLI